MKLALSGSAGTGRNTIAKRLGEKFNLEVITCVTKKILQEEQFDFSQGIKVEKFLARPELQMKIFNYRKKLENEKESFVVDRSWVDQAAYGIVELHDSPEFDLMVYLDDCRDMALQHDLTVYIPWNNKPLTPNGIRTLNPWYQLLVDSVIFNLLNKWEIRYVTLPSKLSMKASVDWISKELDVF